MVKYYSDLSFEWSIKGFKHNLDKDYACFAVWKDGRPYLEKIRETLEKNFDILLESEIIWSEEHFADNANRLYENLINKDIPKEDRKSRHEEKIGDTKFILFVVLDKFPDYTYAQSVSGKIELSNLNVVKAKYEMRDYILERTKRKYGVHSTNSIYEFFFQAPLLLGVDRFKKLIKGEVLDEPQIKKDLEGADGWDSYRALFEVLNLTTNYLVQRSFETLPDKNEELDIDILTDNYQRFASAIGACQHPRKSYKGKVVIEGKEISLDIRYVGDNYYDPVWSKNMLSRKEFQQGVFIPRADDYFFSLLYHCRVQKPIIKAKYYHILKQLAEELNLDWYSTEKLEDNKDIGKILGGFMKSEGYYFYTPIDLGVYKNQEVIKYLPVSKGKTKQKTIKQKIKTKVGKHLPDKIKRPLKCIFRKVK